MPAHRTRVTPARSLEVTTDAPAPPTVSIISPTPRVFNFPPNIDSPYPSPSSSPFDTDPTPFASPFASASASTSSPTSRCFSPAESVSSNSSTPSATSAPALPSSSTHRRQQSTRSVSSDSNASERRPKKGDNDYIKRPENAFILFRRKCCEERKALLQEIEDSTDSVPIKRQRQADLSKTISAQWKTLAPKERQHWEDLAKQKKKLHEETYPDYVYRPQRGKGKKGKGGKKGDDGQSQTDGDEIKLMHHTHHSAMRGHIRSSSAPTPPPGYPSIQLPSVFMPSCPSSPSLMPMISKRPQRPSHLHESTTPFDYAQDQTHMPPLLQQSNKFAHYNPFTNGGVPAHQSFVDKSQLMLLPPLATDYQLSPADTLTSASSGPPSPQYRSPFTPQTLASALPYAAVHEPQATMHNLHPSWIQPGDMEMEMQMRDMQLQYQDLSSGCPAWENHNQEGLSMWPSDVAYGDEFDGMGNIPELELDSLRCDEFGAGASSSGLWNGQVGQHESPYNYEGESTYEGVNNEGFEELFAMDHLDMMDTSSGAGAI